MRSACWRRWAAFAVLLGAVFTSAAAAARAGGGQGFSTGSSSSSHGSSGSSSSGGGAGSSRSSPGFFIVLGVILLPIIAMVVIDQLVFVPRRRRSGAMLGAVDQGLIGEPDIDEERTSRTLDALKEEEDFSEEAFAERVQRIFTTVQQGWSEGDLSAARWHLSDGVLRRFSSQLLLDRHFGRRNVLGAIDAPSVSLESARIEGSWYVVTVSVTASLKDAMVGAAASPEEIAAALEKVEATEFCEYWSFVRRLGAEKARAHLVDAKCPTCGAPVEVTAGATCGSCRAVLNSGLRDWVLAEISQSGAWSEEPLPAGVLNDLLAADPLVSAQLLEDRANLVFWRWIEALATGSPTKLVRLAAPARLEGLLNAGLDRKLLEAVAVGGAALRATGGDGATWRAYLELEWCLGEGDRQQGRASLVTLARPATARTDARLGMSTDRRAKCLGPTTDREESTCAYCGAPLSEDWVLESVEDLYDAKDRLEKEDPRALGWIQGGSGHTREERRRALVAVATLLTCDGKLDPVENDLFKALAQKWDLSSSAPRILELCTQKPATFDASSDQERELVLRAVVAAAAVDGMIDPEELALLKIAAEKLGVEPAALERTCRELAGAASAAGGAAA